MFIKLGRKYTLNLDYLKSFYWAAKSNSISTASEILYISQPGLSMQIKNLEAELGCALLNRSNKGVLLTSAGEIVFDYAKSIFALEENMLTSIKDLENKKNILSIASCKNFGSYYLASQLKNFKDLFSSVDITIDLFNTNEVIEKVLNYDFNIGIILGSSHQDHLEEIEFFNDRFVFFTHISCPYDTLDIVDLPKIPISLRDKQSTTYSILQTFAENNGININDFNVLLSSNCIEIVKAAVLSGCSLSFLPQSCIQFELDHNLLKEVHLTNCKTELNLQYHYSFIKRKQYELNLYEKSFRDFLLSLQK